MRKIAIQLSNCCVFGQNQDPTITYGQIASVVTRLLGRLPSDGILTARRKDIFIVEVKRLLA